MMYTLFSLQSEYQYNITKIKKIDYKGLISEVFKQSSIIFGCESVCEFLKNDNNDDNDSGNGKESKKNKIVNTQLQNFFTAIRDKEYLVCLEYGDHTEDGAKLENMIMPFLDCVVDNFNHH